MAPNLPGILRDRKAPPVSKEPAAHTKQDMPTGFSIKSAVGKTRAPGSAGGPHYDVSGRRCLTFFQNGLGRRQAGYRHPVG